MMPIVLNLDHHCIETQIKRTYNQLLSKYFKVKGSDTEIGNHLKVLEKALRRFDFCYLRATYKALAGGTKARITLTVNMSNTPVLTIDDRIIALEPTGQEK